LNLNFGTMASDLEHEAPYLKGRTTSRMVVINALIALGFWSKDWFGAPPGNCFPLCGMPWGFLMGLAFYWFSSGLMWLSAVVRRRPFPEVVGPLPAQPLLEKAGRRHRLAFLAASAVIGALACWLYAS
jgi:hypothetical protein